MVDRDNTGLTELRRGVLVLAVLSRLQVPQYGYSLRQALLEGGLPVEEGTLYPLLRRLEKQGLLTSEWNTDEARPRKFYRTSPAGDRLAHVLTAEWRSLTAAIDSLSDQEH